jgi:hypothetical protein
MNTRLEEQLSAAMSDATGGVGLKGADLLQRATRRYHRRALIARGAGVVAAAGLAGALAVGVSTVAGGQTRSPAIASPSGTAQPAALRLAAAVSASDHLSYRVKVKDDTQSFEGAFDPATRSGYLRSPADGGAVLTELLVDGTRYVGTEPPPGSTPPQTGPGAHEQYGRYGQYPGTFDRLSYGMYGTAADDDSIRNISATPDPADLFKKLRAVNAKVSENADGSLHFQYSTYQDAHNSSTTSCQVTLDAAKRVSEAVCSNEFRYNAKGRDQTGHLTTTTDLFDYGVTVSVKRPADVVKLHDTEAVK